MNLRYCTAVLALSALAIPATLHAEAKPASVSDINKELQTLRDVPDAKRGARTSEIALQIRALPGGLDKLKLADGLCNLSTEGDFGHDALEDVATTLALALTENPLPSKNGKPARAYLDLAQLVRYEGVTTDFTSPEFTQANDELAANEADVQKADFTLKDMHGKKITLSQLRGNIVLVNFWATWCPPCRKEMPDLDAIYQHFKGQGLVILSLDNEDEFKIGSFLASANYHPTVLFDPNGKVAAQFHVDGIPHSYVFDRDGKLVAEAIDMRTQHQFLMMLAKAGLHP